MTAEKTQPNLYMQVLVITEDYFGPAAPRFIERIINNHFDKAPNSLKLDDLPELTEWVRLTLAILTEHESEVEELTERLSNLYTRRKKAESK